MAGKEKKKPEKFGELRKKAELRLKKKIFKLRQQSVGDPERVLHELQVHQIELEMQNEELRRAQIELEESRNKYTDLYDFAPMGYFTFDKKGQVVEANLTGCRMLGIERGNLIKKPFHIFVSKEYKDTFYLHRQHTLMTGQNQICEITLIRKDGETFEAQLESVPVENAKGDVTTFRTVITDITERKKIERLMNEVRMEIVNEKNRLEAVMETMPIGISIIDEKGGTTQANRAFEEIWGGPRPAAGSIKDYARYKAWWADTGKPLKPQDWASAQAVQQGKTVTGQMLEIERFDGSRAYVINSAAPVFGASGKIAGSVVAILDITKRKKAEQALRKSEEKFHGLFNTMNEGFILFELLRNGAGRAVDCRVLDTNPAVKEMTGFAPADLIGHTVREQFPDIDQFWLDTFEKVETSGNPESFERLFRPLNRYYHIGTYRPAPGQVAIILTDITERKQAEEALRQSEERFKAIASNTPDHLLVQDRELRYTLIINPQLGLTEKDMLGKTDYEILTPDDAEKLTAIKRKVLETGESVHLESSAISRDGRTEYFDGTYVPNHDADGKVDGLIGYFRNVTERKQAEEELRQSEERFKALAEAMPQIVWTADADGGIEWFNQRWYEYTGQPQGIGEGWSWDKVTHPDDMAQTLKNWKDALQRGGLFQNEIRVRRHDGHYHWFLVRAWPMRDARDKVIRWFGTNTDIDELKQAEEALLLEKESYQTLAQNLPGLVYRVHLGDHRRMEFFNQSLAALTGYTEAELAMGELCSLDPLIVPEDRTEVIAEVQQAIEEHRPFEFEYRLRTKTGDLRHFSERGRPIYAPDGNCTHLDGVIFDITERKQAEEALRQSEQRLKLAQASAGAGMWDWDIATDKLEWSEELFSLFGMEPAKGQVSFETWMELVHPDDRLAVRKEIEEAVRNRRPLNGEARIVLESGRVRWINSLGDTIYGDKGEPLRMTGICIDITERKKAEQSLQESELRYRRFFEEDLTGDFITSTDGKILFCNPAFARIFGFANVQDAIGTSQVNLHPDSGSWNDFIELIKKQRVLERYECERLRRNGAIINVVENIIGTFNEKGELTQIKGYLFDDTERKRAEAALRKSNEELSRFNRAAVGRELRMIELKKEINNLCEQTGQPPRYPLDFEMDDYNEKKETPVT